MVCRSSLVLLFQSLIVFPLYSFRTERPRAKRIGRLAPPWRSGSPYALDDFRAEPTVASRPKGRAHTPLVNRYLRHLVCVPWIRLRSFRLPLACDPAPWYAIQWYCHRHSTVQHQGIHAQLPRFNLLLTPDLHRLHHAPERALVWNALALVLVANWDYLLAPRCGLRIWKPNRQWCAS